MIAQTVYTSFDAVDEIFLFREESEEHNILYHILMDFSHVMVDLADDIFEEKIKSNPFLKALVKREDKRTFGLETFFKNMEEEDLSSFPRDIFILNRSASQCDQMMEKNGVLVLPSSDLSGIDKLTRNYRKDLGKNEQVLNEKGLKGWDAYFFEAKLSPVSSLIMLDSYVLKNELGLKNIIEVIRAVMPERLNSLFEILIVTDNRKNSYSQEKIENIIEKIHQELDKTVDYPVSVGIVTSQGIDEELHQRVLITNYHLTETNYGFDVFDDEGKTRKPNVIVSKGIYHTINPEEGDPEVKTVIRKLKAVKNLIEKNKNTSGNVKMGILAGEYSNRLLESFEQA